MIKFRTPQIYVTFGIGDILPAGEIGRDEDNKVHALWGVRKLKNPLPIGTPVDNGKADWEEIPIVFDFPCVESMDSIIKGLQKLRDKLEIYIEKSKNEVKP